MYSAEINGIKVNHKNRVALEIIKQFIAKNNDKPIDYFREQLNGKGFSSSKVIINEEEKQVFIRTKGEQEFKTRYFSKDEERILINTEPFYITSEWGSDSEGRGRFFDSFLDFAKNLGFQINDNEQYIKKDDIKEISILDKIVNSLEGYQKHILTRQQIIDKILKKYPDTNSTSIIPSDYCINLKNKGSSKYELFEYLDNSTYRYIGLNKEIQGLGMKTKNIILYGAPGVGKTHNTNKLISLIDEGKSENEIFSAIKENPKETLILNDDLKSRVQFITFHQSFGYEDFIEGFRPNKKGKIKIAKGIFHNICEDAKLNILESQKNIDTLKKEKLNKTRFEKFIEYLHLNNISQITDTVSITNSDDNAFYYSSQTDAMKNVRLPFSDILECINKNVSSLDDIKNLNNISGTSKQRPTYPFKIVELYNNFIKNDIINFVETNSVSKIERKNYYLVIDEINRGNISKIFGELITLIEEDKRDKIEVTLPYSKEPFKVPSNLFIIGTMNSTDKSIALIDIALRRRFTFLKMSPNLKLIEYKKAKVLCRFLNIKISKTIGKDYQIGHSYFMNISNKDDLNFVLEYKITPLLEEYFYGNKEQLDEILKIIKG